MLAEIEGVLQKLLTDHCGWRSESWTYLSENLS